MHHYHEGGGALGGRRSGRGRAEGGISTWSESNNFKIVNQKYRPKINFSVYLFVNSNFIISKQTTLFLFLTHGDMVPLEGRFRAKNAVFLAGIFVFGVFVVPFLAIRRSLPSM